VYPNPTDGHVYVDLNFPEQRNGTIEVTDMLGKLIYTHAFTKLTAESVDVNLSTYQSGTYFVTVKTGEESVTRKLLKK